LGEYLYLAHNSRGYPQPVDTTAAPAPRTAPGAGQAG
jgi:hypothetical protein